ncbi:ATP-binding mismatch repair protein [Gnomoniopsis sp. IMI 355080]|nr:ATP-binding mismatch repair protein [Gnomoniopsis sp. IMI 355080]
MATIKAIEASSVHQIQSGQVIVDLCSVAKELVENGLDAGATSIEVRFKNQGLDSIEVQDNGSGISPDNHESVALKHYTSKLSTYSDLARLETFGFRGEALSSLCALSQFTVTTCRQADAPKGTKLEFETSGKLKGTSMVAAQKGTTVSVENLFKNLPVRRRELERNVKREWGKVISLLNQYACIQTGVKFSVSQTPNKGKRVVLFSTKGNKTTRDNIVNVFGAKTVSALLTLDLKLELEATSGPSQRWSKQEDGASKEILVKGYVSRPNHGEGRQTPDRQMFYVNSRPCGLPQFAKVFNEVYKSFNSSQSPFIFADIQLDTHLYDVNVSPDKRTILLHDQSRMLENLRDSLTELFEKQDYMMPMTQIATFKQPAFNKPTISRQEAGEDQTADKTPGKAPTLTQEADDVSEASEDDTDTATLSRREKMASAKSLAMNARTPGLMSCQVERKSDYREELKPAMKNMASPATEKAVPAQAIGTSTGDRAEESTYVEDDGDRSGNVDMIETHVPPIAAAHGGDDLLNRLAKLKRGFLPESLKDEISDSEIPEQPPIPAVAKSMKPPDNAPLSGSNARPPKRSSQEVATITIGDHVVTSIIGTPSKKSRTDETAAEPRQSQKSPRQSRPTAPLPSFNGRLTQMFAAAASKGRPSTETDALQAEEIHIEEESQNIESDDPEHSLNSPEAEMEQGEEEEEEEKDVVGQETSSEGSSPLFVEQDEETFSVTSSQIEDDEIRNGKDGEYLDEANKKGLEDSKVQGIVEEAAERATHEATEENKKRTKAFMKGGATGKFSTNVLLQRLKVDVETLSRTLRLQETKSDESTAGRDKSAMADFENGLEAENAEDTLALTIHKGDFGRMKIVGQFNLGFVLAVRPSCTSTSSSLSPPTATQQQKAQDDELFIIDQHASDEKFNFERLQATTILQSQRLVRPKPLELTAIEEEIIIENQSALAKNGFVVAVDESGDEPVGSRCQLLALPLSRETTFTLADLEELISLLGDNPTTTNITNGVEVGGGGYVPRPSKVRKMLAMRACRSSIMIGKSLSRQQMDRIVRHMGEMEKPWNCPHGRPTMRHLCGLGGAWNERSWREGDAAGDDIGDLGGDTDWVAYLRQRKEDV